MRHRLEAQTGTAFSLSCGQLLVVTDVKGEQVADLVAFGAADTREYLSSGRSIDYGNTIRFCTGSVLYSNRSRPMLTIVSDDVGQHDFLLTPCSPETFQIIYRASQYHPSCFENLATALEKFGVDPDRIPTTFNIFMNVEIKPNGIVKIAPPRSRAGDKIVLRAEMDLVIGLTACSAELSNNHCFKPIDYEILPPSQNINPKQLTANAQTSSGKNQVRAEPRSRDQHRRFPRQAACNARLL